MKKFLLALILVFSSLSAHAEAAKKINPADCLPKESANDLVYGGQCANDEDWKKSPKNVGKYEKGKGVPVTKIGGGYGSLIHSLPTVARLALRLAKGYNNIALGLAVAELVGEGVDWVLDPENAVVRTKQPEVSGDCRVNDPYWQKFLFGVDDKGEPIDKSVSAVQACELNRKAYPDYTGGPKGVIKEENNVLVCGNSRSLFTCAIPDEYQPEKEIPIEELAQILQKLAEEGEHVAQKAIEDTVEDMAKAGELDDELERAKKLLEKTKGTSPTKDTDTSEGPKDEAKTKEETNAQAKEESTPFELPEFCAWAKPVCDFIDWVKKEPDEDTTIDVGRQPNINIDTNINFGGSCPANVVVPFGLSGYEQDITLMDWSKLCLLLSTYLKPLVIALSSYQAIRILAGQKQ